MKKLGRGKKASGKCAHSFLFLLLLAFELLLTAKHVKSLSVCVFVSVCGYLTSLQQIGKVYGLLFLFSTTFFAGD